MGWYQANGSVEETGLPERAIKVADTIKKNNGNKAIIFLVRKFSNVTFIMFTFFFYVCEIVG